MNIDFRDSVAKDHYMNVQASLLLLKMAISYSHCSGSVAKWLKKGSTLGGKSRRRDLPFRLPPQSSNATPSSPFSKVVSLIDWWLIKSDTDFNGKRLAVGGIQAQGNYATKIFTSAPIVKRRDAFTVETADGITLTFHGFINKPRSYQNGILPEVVGNFLIGFPYNWECYADGDFGSKPILTTTLTTTSTNGKPLEHSSDAGRVFPIHMPFMKLLNVLISRPDTASIDDVLRRNSTCTSKESNGSISVDATLHASSDARNFCTPLANTRLHVEILERREMDKSNQNNKDNEGCANRNGHDPVGNATGHADEASCSSNELHDGVHGEGSEIDDRVYMSNNCSLTVEQNCKKQNEVGKNFQTDHLLQKGVELEKDNNVVANSDVAAPTLADNEGELNDESTVNSVELIAAGVFNALSTKEQKRLNLQQCNKRGHCAAKIHNNAEEKTVQDGVSQDLPLRKDSVAKVSDFVTEKMSFPSEASFESPAAGAQRSEVNESTSNSAGLPVKIGSSGFSPMIISTSHAIHKRKLQGYRLTSHNRATRIRVQTPVDSEVLAGRKVGNVNETYSLPVATERVLETAIISSENVKERKLNDKLTINSANHRVERVSVNRWPTKGHDSHNKTGRRRSGYALRSLDHVGKSGMGNMGISKDSLEEKDSENDANSCKAEMDVPFELVLHIDARKVCKARNQKGKMLKSGTTIPSKRAIPVVPSFSASQDDNSLSHVEQEAMHIFQSPLTRNKAKKLSVRPNYVI